MEWVSSPAGQEKGQGKEEGNKDTLSAGLGFKPLHHKGSIFLQYT